MNPSAERSRDEVGAALSRVIDAVRRMPPARLGAPIGGPFTTRADAARALARALAITGQGIEEAGSATAPAWRDLPDVPDLVVGDQLAVLAEDLRLGLAADPPSEVWTPDGRAPLADVVRDVLATAQEVRRLL
jgi:hypothetical protein